MNRTTRAGFILFIMLVNFGPHGIWSVLAMLLAIAMIMLPAEANT